VMNTFYPNTTQFPDELLDYWMAHVSHAEWKVLCYIVRHTYGFRKSADSISFTQFADGMKRSDGSYINHGCGIKSHATLSSALTELEKRGLVGRTISPKVKGVKTATTLYEFKPLARDQDNGRLYIVDKEPGAFTERTPKDDVTSSLSEPQAFTERTSSQFTERTPPSSLSEHTTPTFTTPTQHPQAQETGANAPTARSVEPVEDLPEWGPAVVAPWTIDAETPQPMMEDIPATPPVTATTSKSSRKATLQQSEPEIYTCREAIKARYFERYTAETWDTLARSKQTYANDDAERIARVCVDLDEAYGLMQAVWDERWSNGTYPNRAPFKLSRCPEKLKAYRNGLLTATATPRPSNVGRPADSQVGTGRKDGLRYNPIPQYYSCDRGIGNRLGCGFAEGFSHETETCGRTGIVTPGEETTRAAS